MLRMLYYAGLRALGVPRLVRGLRKKGLILCYHNVWPAPAGPPAGDTTVHLPLERFVEQVSWLTQHYTVVPLGELVKRVNAGRSLRGLATLTFDDGYAGVFSHAWPLLVKLGLPATVFVVTGVQDSRDVFWWDHSAVTRSATPEQRDQWLTELRGNGDAITKALGAAPAPPLPPSHRPADWDAIAQAADAGLALGAHSVSHRTLTRLDDVQLEREIVASRRTIRAHAGADPEFFAYPYGIWDARVRDAVRAAGYRGAVTLDYGLVAAGTDPWALPRVNVPAPLSLAAFEAWAAGLAPRRGPGGSRGAASS